MERSKKDVDGYEELSRKVSLGLVGAELVFSLWMVARVRYTEIDYAAYMQEVDGVFREKRLDYAELSGSTGPLVYPAGFVYAYGLLRWLLTPTGNEVWKAQIFFACVYAFNQGVAMTVTRKTRCVPILFFPVFCLSKRIHSIFALRMFNDGLCATMCHVAVLMFSERRARAGFLWLSLATSVKMNALLYLPPALVILVGYHAETMWEVCVFHSNSPMVFHIGRQGCRCML